MTTFNIDYNITAGTLEWRNKTIKRYDDGSIEESAENDSRGLSFDVNTGSTDKHYYETITFQDQTENVDVVQGTQPKPTSKAYDANGNVVKEIAGDTIPTYWANGDVNIVRIEIADGVTSIGASAFNQCPNLTSVTLPDTLTSIGDMVCYQCTSLTSIDIPSGVTSIGTWSFYQCPSLTSVTLSDNLTSIGDNAFAYCSGLTSIDIPSGVTSIGTWAFNQCTSLTSIVIPNGVTTIGNYFFYNCKSLTSVTLSDNLTSIGGNAFSNCTSLTSIDIPSGVTSISGTAFFSCSNLSEIVCYSETELTNIGLNAFFNLPYSGTLYTPNSTNDWSTFLSYLPAGWRQEKKTVAISKAYDNNGNVICEVEGDIPSRWLYQKTNVYRVEIGDGVKSIGEESFSNCSNLTELIIPDSVTDIGNGYVTNMCQKLTRLVIGNGITIIPEYAFTNCNRLSSVTIGYNVSLISSRAFNFCSDLKSIICLGSNEISVADDAFSGIWTYGTLYTPNASTNWSTFLSKFSNEWTQSFTLPN